MDNIEITKQNGNIAFAECQHKYWDVTDPSKKFISVTTIIEKFTQPFDKNFWSSYKALQELLPEDAWKIEKKSLLSSKKFDKTLLNLYNIPEDSFNKAQQDILDKWDEENRKSCERGTKIHADLENSFYKKKKNIDISKYQIGGTFECKKDYTDLDLENAVYPEYLIHRVSPDGELCIAGQIDLLVKKGNHITIGDWKGLPLGTPIPTPTGWTKLKNLKEGDTVFDKDGKPTKILHKSKVHHNPCYLIKFDTGERVVADHEHRWEITFEEDDTKVLTTEELITYLPQKPKIYNINPIENSYKELKHDLYVVGCSLSDSLSNVAKEYLVNTNYIFDNNKINIKVNYSKYLAGSLEQRKEILKGLIDSSELDKGYYLVKLSKPHTTIKLLGSLGIKFYVYKKNHKVYIKFKLNNPSPYRLITQVLPIETVPTQCLEVDSPTHTFLFSEGYIVTHNTNKKIETTSYFDNKTKKSVMMKYPLNNLQDCNYAHYSLQLSTYAWMMQKLNPEYIIDDLVLVHFDHSDNMTVYHLPYLKEEVEKMLAFYKKQVRLENSEKKRKRIEY